MRRALAIAMLLAITADAAAIAGEADAVAGKADAVAVESDSVAKEAHAVAAGAGAVVREPHAMSYREMADTMQMDDTARFGKVMFDQLEWRDGGAGEGRAAWDAQGYYGGDYDKLWIKTEGKYVSGGRDPTGASGTGGTGGTGGASGAGGRGTKGPDSSGIRDADVEVLWNRVISAWWNVQAGGRQDFGPGQSRTWAAVGLQGLAPQWFETEATVYASDEGRTAARLKAQYDLLLTQRFVLQPFAEANLYGRSDPAHHIGSGLSDLEISIRLRYEVRRECAPYVGLVWLRRFGGTADLARSAGGDASDLELVAGLRVWF